MHASMNVYEICQLYNYANENSGFHVNSNSQYLPVSVPTSFIFMIIAMDRREKSFKCQYQYLSPSIRPQFTRTISVVMTSYTCTRNFKVEIAFYTRKSIT